MAAHPTAVIEPGVSIGRNTSIWDHAHIRHSTRIGEECIIGGKTYIAYGVTIGNRVKINSFVYICTDVTIETGVMISAGVVFTNDRFPRATTPDLKTLALVGSERKDAPDAGARRSNDWRAGYDRSRCDHWPLCHGRYGIGGDARRPGSCHRLREPRQSRRLRLCVRRKVGPRGAAQSCRNALHGLRRTLSDRRFGSGRARAGITNALRGRRWRAARNDDCLEPRQSGASGDDLRGRAGLRRPGIAVAVGRRRLGSALPRDALQRSDAAHAAAGARIGTRATLGKGADGVLRRRIALSVFQRLRLPAFSSALAGTKTPLGKHDPASRTHHRLAPTRAHHRRAMVDTVSADASPSNEFGCRCFAQNSGRTPSEPRPPLSGRSSPACMARGEPAASASSSDTCEAATSARCGDSNANCGCAGSRFGRRVPSSG